MRYLALDIATHCGWCLYDSSNGTWTSGVWNLSAKKTKKLQEDDFVRLKKIQQQLNAILESGPIDVLGWEAVNFSKFTLAHAVWNQLFGSVQLWRMDNNIQQSISVHTGTLKKFATGSGSAGKEEMIAAASKLLPNKVIADDNEADAIMICAYMILSIKKAQNDKRRMA